MGRGRAALLKYDRVFEIDRKQARLCCYHGILWQSPAIGYLVSMGNSPCCTSYPPWHWTYRYRPPNLSSSQERKKASPASFKTSTRTPVVFSPLSLPWWFQWFWGWGGGGLLRSKVRRELNRIVQGRAQTNQAPHFPGWSNEVERWPLADPGNL